MPCETLPNLLINLPLSPEIDGAWMAWSCVTHAGLGANFQGFTEMYSSDLEKGMGKAQFVVVCCCFAFSFIPCGRIHENLKLIKGCYIVFSKLKLT